MLWKAEDIDMSHHLNLATPETGFEIPSYHRGRSPKEPINIKSGSGIINPVATTRL